MSVHQAFGYVHVGVAFVGCLAAFFIALFFKKRRDNALLNSIALALTAATYLTIVGLDNASAAWARWLGYALIKAFLAYSLASVFERSLTRCFMVAGLTFTYNLLGAVLYFLTPEINRWFMFGGAASFLVMTIPLILFDENFHLKLDLLKIIHLVAFVVAQVAIGIVLGTGAPLADVLSFSGQTIAYAVLDIFAIYVAAAINIFLPSIINGELSEMLPNVFLNNRVRK